MPVTEEARAEQEMPSRDAGAMGLVAGPAQGQPAAPPPATGRIAAGGSVNPQRAKQPTYRHYGASWGAAWLTFIVGLLLGAPGSIVSLTVGAVRGLRT